jgi:hypothetical protein
MSANSPVFYSVQYASAVELLSQQLTPRIANSFTPMTAEGKSATVVDQIDAIEADERTTRYDDIVPGDPAQTRPWVFPRHFDKAVFLDTIDQVRMNANPQSQYVQAVVAAINRKMDDEGIRAFFDARLTGENGTTSENFASAMQVGTNVGGTSSGLNVEKIQSALEILRALEVGLEDNEQINCVISPKQERNLMNEIEVTSSEFTAKRIIDSGTMVGSNFMSINWIISNRLLVDGSSLRRVPFYTKRGMAFSTWGGGRKTNVTQRMDKRGLPWQVYTEGHFGAVRRDAKRVVEIKCTES